MRDLVIPLGTESIWNDNDELRYALRSFQKNIPDLGRIIIVGEKPAWLNGVIHIPANDPFRHHKDANIIRKILLAIHQVEDLSDEFYWSCDDHLILRPATAKELRPYFISELKNEPSEFWQGGVWKQGLFRTMEYLQVNGHTTYHYDSHIPMPVKKSKFREIMEQMVFKEHERYTINTLYFNQALRSHRHIGILKARFEMPYIHLVDVEALTYNRLYLAYNNQGLTPALKQFIQKQFPEKSQYE